MTTPFAPGDLVAGYFRDSGGDEQDLSVERQVGEFRRWLAEHRLREGQIFQDAARPGSTTAGRQGFQAMIRHFRSGLAKEKGLAVWRSNRFGRNVNDNQFFKADLRRRGYVIHSLTDQIPPDRYGQLIEYLLDWKDEQFLEDLREDVASGLRLIVETYGAMPGFPPRGFTRQEINVGFHRNGRPHILHRWVPDETMTPLVRRAFQMLLEGAPLIQIQIATGLYNSLNSWATFFRNPLYKGTLHFKDLVIENYCEPVVEPAVWERAQHILDTRAGRRHLNADDARLGLEEQQRRVRQHPRRVSSPWLLSGIAHCARCGAPLNGHIIETRRYYFCSKAKRRRDCDAVQIPAASLEAHVLQSIRDLLADPAALAAAQSRQLAQYIQSAGDLSAQRGEKVTRLENLHREITNITVAIRKHGDSAALLDSLTALETQEYELKKQIAQLDAALRAKPEPINPDRVQRLAKKFDTAMAEGTPEERRQALAGWILRLDVERTDPKHVLVGMDVFVPPKSGPDPPASHDRIRAQHPEPPQGYKHRFGGVFVCARIRPMKKLVTLLILLTSFAAACGTAELSPTPQPSASSTVLPSKTPTLSPTPRLPTLTVTPALFEGTLTIQVNVRSGPGTSYESLGLLDAGETVQILRQNVQKNWYQILYTSAPQGTAWIIAQYVQIGEGVEIPLDVTPTLAGPTGRVTQRLNVRSGPGTTFDSLGLLEANTLVSLTGKNSTASWFQIDYPAGPDGHGWVTAQYIQTDSAGSLPVLDDYGMTVTPEAAETPSGPAMTATPTVGPAFADGDSRTVPAVRVEFSGSGMRRFVYSSQVSVPSGDGEDWIEFTPYAASGRNARLLFSLSCSGSSALTVELWQGGSSLSDWGTLECGDADKPISLPAGQPYQLGLFPVAGEGPQLASYSLTVQNNP